ncbi:uncharacterized protein CDV56_101484 [Aspergillus thermomutatus]|uniref:BTB domain-containing protein n=1 Tax=Aspergillus thermomutatus TaxID=41047 RepID=A0A397G9P3_ASPTH|nr:uncharacterized protein CDV56_101484 [Aspergillus thermomutatus]RHZ47691.1 hypothetical protein CDV56_101484 [Aspergillus thermomutatus]
MEPARYVIDPEGDVLLVINQPPSSSHPSWLKKEPQDSSVSTATSTSNRNDTADCTSSGDGLGGVEIRVSSRHLVLASRFFEEKLSSKDKILRSDEMVLVAMEVEDVDALLIVLNMMHCRTSKVPRLVGLRVLCKIAGLVYEYRCFEAVEVFSSIWIDNLKERLPWCFSEDLVRWIFISWVFHHELIFQETTLVAVRQSTGPIQCYGLPIPQPLLGEFFPISSQKAQSTDYQVMFGTDSIEQKRRNWVNSIIAWIYEEKERLLDDGECCELCDAMHIGWLSKQLHAHNLYPPPSHPFSGLSVKFLEDTLRVLPDPPCNQFHAHSKVCIEKSCAVLPGRTDLLWQLMEEETGLELTEFLA